MILDIRHVTIKALPVYVCSKCPTVGVGSTVRTEFDGVNIDLATLRFNVSNQHIPVGWSSYGRDDVRCPTCTKEK